MTSNDVKIAYCVIQRVIQKYTKNFFSERIALDFQKELYINFFVNILKAKHDFFKLLSKQMTQ